MKTLKARESAIKNLCPATFMATNFFIKSYYMFLIIDFAYKNMQKKKSFGQLITKIRQNVAINFMSA